MNMFDRCCEYQSNSMKTRYQRFFEGFGSFTDVVTIPLKHRHPKHETYWREEFAEKNAIWFLNRLNKKFYGRAYIKGYKKLSVVTSYERGYLTSRPHFHMVIERPRHIRREKFHDAIKSTFKSMEWGFGTIDIRDYTSPEFISYMCKGDHHKIILCASFRA